MLSGTPSFSWNHLATAGSARTSEEVGKAPELSTEARAEEPITDRSLATLETTGGARWMAPPGFGVMAAGNGPACRAPSGESHNKEERELSAVRCKLRSAIVLFRVDPRSLAPLIYDRRGETHSEGRDS